MEQNSISGFNSDQESFQNSGEGTKLKSFNFKLGSFNVICAKNRSSHRGAWAMQHCRAALVSRHISNVHDAIFIIDKFI